MVRRCMRKATVPSHGNKRLDVFENQIAPLPVNQSPEGQ